MFYSLEDQIRTLQHWGFTFTETEEALVESLLYQYSRAYYENEPYSFLMSVSGAQHLSESYEEVRFSHDMWSFDLYGMDGSRNYVAIVRELTRLSKGDFVVDQCKYYVDNETEEAHISFRYHGLMFNWDISPGQGGLDFNLIKKFGKLASRHSKSKQYYYAKDDLRITVIYCQPELVKQLNALLKHTKFLPLN